jgi:hypothetical protein
MKVQSLTTISIILNFWAALTNNFHQLKEYLQLNKVRSMIHTIRLKTDLKFCSDLVQE